LATPSFLAEHAGAYATLHETAGSSAQQRAWAAYCLTAVARVLAAVRVRFPGAVELRARIDRCLQCG
jgi:hypothetical protein